MSNARHPESDRTPVEVEASDAIDAVGALLQLARRTRSEARRRCNAGPRLAAHRRQLRDAATVYEAAAARMQRAADRRFER